MDKINKIFSTLLLTSLLSISCSNDFDPAVKDYHDNIMVFTILDNRNNSQEAFVQKMYQVLNERNRINNCELLIVENDTGYHKFRDTVINDEQYAHYYLSNLELKRGAKYELLVIRDSIVQDRALVHMQNIPVSEGSIYNITVAEKTFDPLVRGYVRFSESFLNSPNDCYYIFKSYIQYEKIKNGISSIKYSEILPNMTYTYQVNPIEGAIPVWKWPKHYFQQRESIEFTKTKIPEYQYDGFSIVYALIDLSDTYDHKDITIKRAFTVVYTIDEKLFDNFIGDGTKWNEKISMRFDHGFSSPDIFTRSNGINGFFGAVSVDTISFKVPKDIIDILGYNNGQK